TSRQPLRVLVDSRFEVNPAARILEGGSTLVACAVDAAKRVAKTAALEELGCEVITLPDANGKVDLAGLLLELARRGINELHVEAGYRLNGSLLREECIDELLVYMAPTLLGNSMGLADLAPPEALEKRLVLHWQSVERVGDDLRLLARLPERI
ncbi:MAG: RibD family protein, partial [Steroidobacteraceae bacterium]|nr:RibD family protein [Steroidobacteraceae bacterium]